MCWVEWVLLATALQHSRQLLALTTSTVNTLTDTVCCILRLVQAMTSTATARRAMTPTAMTSTATARTATPRRATTGRATTRMASDLRCCAV